MGDYAKALGSKLRGIRQQQGLSLHGVEQKSGGRWKAVVVGSYERGDRAVTVQKLAELADFYGVPVAELLPEGRVPSGSEPAAKIVILTMSEEESDLFEAVRAGANGYVLKNVQGDQVAEGVRAVYSGDSLISPSMASKLLAEFALMRRRDNGDPNAGLPKLTEREVEVLGLVARGLANKEIGRQLFISENTVKNHVRNILEKLQLHSRMEAVMYAVRQNLIEPPQG